MVMDFSGREQRGLCLADRPIWQLRKISVSQI